MVLTLRFTVFRTEPVPVTVFRVARGLVEDTVTNSEAGTIRTRKRAMLSPEVGGRVAALPVREGETVAAGQVLLRLADADYRARVALAERAAETSRAARRQACLAAEQAARDYERNQRLLAEQIVSEELLDRLRSERDVAVAACDAAEARVLEAEAALELAGVELAKTVLRAPFAGAVAEVSTEVGEWVTPSPPALPVPPVIELIAHSSIYLSAQLDEVDVAKVEVGQPVRITIDAYPDRDFSGTVTRVAPYVVDIEQHSRTFEIEVEFDDAEFAARLLPGTSADVEVILDTKPDVLRVPTYALIDGRRVLLVEDGRLVSRDVTTGLRNWSFTEIERGLAPGEPVVVSLDRAEVKSGARAVISGETLR
ncbi:MAG TPA: efflux RND transporter periplasmic adaptor subunit [Candidatus Polarisedimenticolaceae bacterium]|nr:efflux RND transporter periplasmic adaptor subunit [Candidatus Polarisedimenticolaceae bacterium]